MSDGPSARSLLVVPDNFEVTMRHTPSSLLTVALLCSAAHAQCPRGGAAGLVPWSAADGYASTFAPDDEGITSPPIVLTAFPAFPMPGVTANLDRMWVGANGEIYLTDSTMALTAPVGGAPFGVNSLSDMRGGVPGSSARIVPLGGDLAGSRVVGASWSVYVDQSVMGQVTVTWTDIGRFANATDRFSMLCTLHASGAVEFSYGTTFPSSGFTGRWVGISTGNQVGSTSSPNRDLGSGADSGSEGLLYQSFTGTAPHDWDLSGTTLRIAPNGSGGYAAQSLGAFVPPPCASNTSYGTGCYSYQDVKTSIAQLFPGAPAAKAALDGNSLTCTLLGNTYLLTWTAGGAAGFVAPSASATVLPLTDDGSVTVSTSVATPTSVGQVPSWKVSANGILTAGSVANNGTDFTPTLSDVANATVAPGLGFCSWHDYNPAGIGSGQVEYEEVAGVAYITWNGVDAYGTPSATPSTWQFQIDESTGTIRIVWVSMSAATGPTSNAHLVGATLDGPGLVPPSTDFATSTPLMLGPDTSMAPLALTASPRPVIAPNTPGTTVTYTVSNIPPLAAGTYFTVLVLGRVPTMGPGIEMLPAAPECFLHVWPFVWWFFPTPLNSPTQTHQIHYSDFWFDPGEMLYAQAFALIPPWSLPNGQNAMGVTSSNGIAHELQAQ